MGPLAGRAHRNGREWTMTDHGGVAVVVPCFNAGAVIAETIASLQDQSLPPAEIIIVDDCSTDPDTHHALQALGRQTNVRVLHQDSNRGPGAARNAGVVATTSPNILFLDSDDTLNPEALECLARALHGDRRSGFAYVSVQCFGNTRHWQEAPPFNPYVLHVVNFCTSAALFRRSVFETGMRFCEDRTLVTEDWDMFLRVVEQGFTGVPAPDAVLHYRRYGYSRIDGSDADGRQSSDLGFEQRQRRPELFTPSRLLKLKARAAPAVTVYARNDHALLDALRNQTLRDHAVGGGKSASGKIICAVSDPSAIEGDPWFLERLLAPFETAGAPPAVIAVRSQALRRSAWASSRLTDVETTARGLRPSDIVGVGVPQLALQREMAPAQHADHVFRTAARLWSDHAPAIAVIPAGPTGPRLVDDSEATLWLRQSHSYAPTTVSGHPVQAGAEWEQNARLGCPGGISWRVAAGGAGLFPPAKFRSRLRRLTLVHDRRFDTPFFLGPEEQPWEGCEIVRPDACGVHVAEAQGTTALLRVIDPATHERLVTVQPVPDGMSVEAHLGFVETQAVPGSMPIASLLGDPDRPAGWAFPARVASREERQHVTPVIGGFRVWRSRNSQTGIHEYGRRGMATDGNLVLEGPLLEMLTVPDLALEQVPILSVASANGPATSLVGLITRELVSKLPSGLRAGPTIGFLPSHQCHPLQRPIYVSVHPKSLDLLVSNMPTEGSDEGYVQLGVLGYAIG